MPRNGRVTLPGLVVQSIYNSTASARVVLSVGNWTVTIERTAKLPDDINPRPGESMDMAIDYDPRN